MTISAKMHPIDQVSTPVEYCFDPKRISGARYHKVTTYIEYLSKYKILAYRVEVDITSWV